MTRPPLDSSIVRDLVTTWFDAAVDRRGIEPTPNGHLDAVLGKRYRRRKAVEQAFLCYAALLDLAAPKAESFMATLWIGLAPSEHADMSLPNPRSLQKDLPGTNLSTRVRRVRHGRIPLAYGERQQLWHESPELELFARAEQGLLSGAPNRVEIAQDVFHPSSGVVRCYFVFVDTTDDEVPLFHRAVRFEHHLE